MSVHKVIEVLANTGTSWEDAAQQAVADACKTIRNIESVYVKDLSVRVDNDKISEYRLNAKITFRVD